jgi:hypothetical protein
MYRNPIMRLREHKKDGYKDAGHDIPFKPAKVAPKQYKSEFEHITDFKNVKKNLRDAEGAVIT